MDKLVRMNEPDMELYEYAKQLYTQRTTLLQVVLTNRLRGSDTDICIHNSPGFVDTQYRYHPSNPRLQQEQFARDTHIPVVFRKHIGLFQPPGHKGP